MQYRLTTPVSKDDLAPLRAGDTVLLSGPVYTSRDAAQQRIDAVEAKMCDRPVRQCFSQVLVKHGALEFYPRRHRCSSSLRYASRLDSKMYLRRCTTISRPLSFMRRLATTGQNPVISDTF